MVDGDADPERATASAGPGSSDGSTEVASGPAAELASGSDGGATAGSSGGATDVAVGSDDASIHGTIHIDTGTSVEIAATAVAARSGATGGPFDTDADSDAPPIGLPGETETGISRAGRVHLERGTLIGRYVVIDLIGRGGMGDVYAAYDPELSRRIALKLVRDPSGSGRARLIEEAQAMARVSHPNVLAVYDAGTFGDAVFIATELVDGETLATWRRRARDRKDILATFEAAGRGLAAAHAAGIVHRDFKPGNVMIGSDGRVRVLDFGLARVEGGWPVDPSTVSDDDTIDDTAITPGQPRVLASRGLGTPRYMAPEQRRPGVHDARADQFSFGVALYEALYGELPFAGDDRATLAANVAAGAVRPPPRDHDVPAWVRRIVVRALAADPADRYPSMDELLAELSHDPAARRSRLALAAVGLGLLALAVWGVTRRGGHAPAPCRSAGDAVEQVWSPGARAALTAGFAATGRPRTAGWAERVAGVLDHRAREWRAARIATCRATAVHGEQSGELLDLRMACLDRRLGELDALTRALASPDAALMDRALDAVAALPSLDTCADTGGLLTAVAPPTGPDARARIAKAEDALAEVRARALAADVAEARTRADRALALAVAGGHPPLIAEALIEAARAASRAGDSATAEDELYRAATTAAEARADRTAAAAWIDLVAVVGSELGRPREGLALVHAADAALARVGRPRAMVADLAHDQALVLAEAGDLPAAAAREEEALDARTAASGPGSLAVADSLNQLAHIRSRMGEHAQAEVLHRSALAIRTEVLGADHPDVASSLNNLGAVLSHQGKFDEAEQLYQRALDLRIASLGPEHADVGTSLNNLGGLFLDRGDLARADDYLTRALANWEKSLGPEHRDLAIPLGNLGDVALARDDPARALTLCRRGLAVETAASGDDSPELAYPLTCIGEAELATGARADAITTLERALRLRTDNTVDPGELARTRLALARALTATRPARARELAASARDGFAAAGSAWDPRRAEADALLARLR